MPAQLRSTVPDKSGRVSPRRLDYRHVRRVKRAICRSAADGEARPTACRIYRAMSSEFEVSAAEPSVAEFATQLPTVVVAGVPLGYIERRLSATQFPFPTRSSSARPTAALAKSMLRSLRPPSGRSAFEGCLRQRGRRVVDDRSAGFAQCDRPRQCRTHDGALLRVHTVWTVCS